MKVKGNTFGSFLREQRKKCELSQFQLGALLGVSDKAVSKWESDLAKPQSHLLHRLSTILGVTVDELLAGQAIDVDKEKRAILENCGLIWKKAYKNLMSYYNNAPPIEALSRYENEKSALMNSDIIQFFEVISLISDEAEKMNSQVMLVGGVGSSFVAYLLKATDVNPLPAHYYCPVCKTTQFMDTEADGWELPRRYCETCHSLVVRDGHNLSFECYKHIIGKNASFDLVISKDFYQKAKALIIEYFGHYGVRIIKPPVDLPVDLQTFVVKPVGSLNIKNDESCILSNEEYMDNLSRYPYINLISYEKYEKYITLRRKVKVFPKQIDCFGDEILQQFSKRDLGKGFLKFELNFLNELKIDNFSDLLKLYGISFVASACQEKEEFHIKKVSEFGKTMVYRDDVFQYVYSKMTKKGYYDSGLAYMVMDKARKGIYHRNGVDENTRKILLDIGCSEKFITDLEEILYLFPKAQGVLYVKHVFVLMWYKVYYPEIFEMIFQNDI